MKSIDLLDTSIKSIKTEFKNQKQYYKTRVPCSFKSEVAYSDQNVKLSRIILKNIFNNIRLFTECACVVVH